MINMIKDIISVVPKPVLPKNGFGGPFFNLKINVARLAIGVGDDHFIPLPNSYA